VTTIVLQRQTAHSHYPTFPTDYGPSISNCRCTGLLPGYDAYVWIDGNIEVTSPDFVKVMTEGLERDDIVIQRHHERQTIKQEIDFILASENEYLTTRYGAQPLREEYDWYLRQGMPESAALYSCNIFAFVSRPYPVDETHTVSFFDEWWKLCLEWSWFDQSAFSFLAWKTCVAVTSINLGPMFNNPYFILHPHSKPFQ
jgi:hypothetical protein